MDIIKNFFCFGDLGYFAYFAELQFLNFRIIEMYNEATYQQRVLRAATSNGSSNRGSRGGYPSSQNWNSYRGGGRRGSFFKEGEKTSLGEGDVGPQPSTTTTATTILTVQLSLPNKEIPTTTSSTTQITYGTTSNTAKITNNTSTSLTTTTTNNKLRHSNRRHTSRQLTTTFFTPLENNNRSPMANFSNTTWLPATIFEKTNTLEESTEKTISRRPTSYQLSNSKIPRRWNDRGITNSKSKFSLKILHFAGKNKKTTYPRLPKIKQLYSSGTFQNGRCASITRANRKRRLHLQNRSQRRLCHSTNSCRLSRFPEFRERRNSLPLQDFSLWPKYRTKSILKDHEVCHRTAEEKWCPHNLLLG